ncbi:LysR family transcriptional regulator [Sphingomonas sp. ASY06-1R]|jgi:DNA-binding transcriptional LysR family regulator|uniref:LysR family transcriptional regulator n=1 Tax=Sphingomonas sp. ASY06-1R TaxID=3445771 RepID=UPI003FA248C1
MLIDDLDVSLPQLRCFVAVVDAASLAEAGRRLGMSAASVSKAIVRLEQSAGARLLHRSTHALSLTSEGEALLQPARAVLAAALHFREIAGTASSDGGVGTVRVSASVGFSRAVLAPLLAGFSAAHPGVQVDVRASNDFVSLADEGIDLALRSGPLEGIPGHVQQRWFSFPWIFCAAPDYLARRGTPETIEDLADHDLIGFRNLRTGQVQGWPFRTVDGGSGRLAPAARLIFDDGDSGWQACLAGAGVACTPFYLAQQPLRAGQAIEILRPYRDDPVTVSIIRRDRRLTPRRVTTLIEYLLDHTPLLSDADAPAEGRVVR